MKALLALMFISFAIAGCASTPEPPHLAANQDTCWVCVHENDQACMKVDIDDKTPTVQYNGKTYRFCSEECRKEFVASPAKYEKLASAYAPQTQPAHH